MDWLKDVYNSYKNAAKFVFGFYTEISHNDNNLAETADDDIVDTLKSLHEGGYLNNTMLILMSDHGARFSDVRATLQGKQEERMPFVGFAFPKWFEKKYPDAVRNLRTNVNRLTTPFDMHATLMDMLQYSASDGYTAGKKLERSLSMFKEIPKSRTCSDAGIDPHWCACLNWHAINRDSSLVIEAGEFVVSKINEYIQIRRDICSPLKLYTVTKALQFLPEKSLLLFKRSKDEDGRYADMSDDTRVSDQLLQIWVHTLPGNGLFEATLHYDMRTRSFTLPMDSISRINMYGDDAHCVITDNADLRKYCYCREKKVSNKH
jgi:hypothetical protein